MAAVDQSPTPAPPPPQESPQRSAGDRSALQRTFLSWIRTGIVLSALGFVILRLGYYLERLARMEGETEVWGRFTTPIGLLHLLVGGGMIVVAGIWHRRSEHSLTRGGADPRWLGRYVVIGITAASLIGGIGLDVDLLITMAR